MQVGERNDKIETDSKSTVILIKQLLQEIFIRKSK